MLKPTLLLVDILIFEQEERVCARYAETEMEVVNKARVGACARVRALHTRPAPPPT